MKIFKSYNEFSLVLEATETLKMNLPKDIEVIHNAFKRAGFKLYVVGGSVRDAILKKTPKDFDLATDAKPDEVQRLLNNANIHNFPKGEAFGVISATFKHGDDTEEYEIATFREDIGKGRRPDAVNFTTIDKDVLRRDLTINALFYDIDTKEVVDLTGGIKDLMDKIIRTVGDPLERFGEDDLRKLRALRFKHLLGAKLEDKIDAALRKDPSLTNTSFPRRRDEFKKSIEKAKDAKLYLEDIEEFNFWPEIFPELYNQINKDYISSNNFCVQLAQLFLNIDMTSKIESYLKEKLAYEVDEIRAIIFLKMLTTFNPDNIIEVVKKRDIAGVDLKSALEFGKYNSIDSSIIKGIYDHVITTSGTDPEFSGLKGKAIGDKMREIESEKFRKKYM